MKNKPQILGTLILILALNAITVNTVQSLPALTRIYIDNPKLEGIQSTFTAEPGETFQISIEIRDVLDLYAWELRMSWNATVLRAHQFEEGGFLQLDRETWFFHSNKTEGILDLGCTAVGDVFGVDGSGTLAKITFLVKDFGEALLELSSTTLIDHYQIYPASYIPHEAEGGYFSNLGLPDIAITNIAISSTAVQPGEIVNINVTAENQGLTTETFNVTLYYDTTVIDTVTNITLEAEATTIVPFTWNTTGILGGTFTIKAQASFLEREADTGDNIRLAGPVIFPSHDIAITSVTPSPTKVTAGETVNIAVTVKNVGQYTETSINVTVYYDTTMIERQTITTLEPNATRNLTFAWDTTDVPPESYIIKAEADTLPGEVETNNNVRATPWQDAVEITVPGPSFAVPLEFIGIVVGIAIVCIVVIAYLKMKKSS